MSRPSVSPSSPRYESASTSDARTRSRTVRKRKPSALPANDDFFDNAEAPADDLFSSSPSAPSASTAPNTSTSTSTLASQRPGPLTPSERRARFATLHAHLAARIGRSPAVRTATSAPRSAALSTLFDLAQDGGELERTTELFASFAAGGRTLRTTEAENFVRACPFFSFPPCVERTNADSVWI
jgi:hypothetical protein